MVVYTMISFSHETRERVYKLKGPQRTYDNVVSEAITLLEEKLKNEHRPQSTKTSGTGNHEGDQ
jgi:hypothetical protein